MLNRLPLDILIYFCVEFLEVSDVVNLERVNKFFLAELRRSHYLWLSFLQDLDIDHAPELPHNVNVFSLSSVEIRQLYIRALKGFHNWHRKGGPLCIRKVVIQKNLFDKGTDPNQIKDVKMVPGGTFIVLHRCIGTLELWDITSQTSIASYAPFSDQDKESSSPEILEFETTFTEKIEEVVIFAVARCTENPQDGNERSTKGIMAVAIVDTKARVVSEVFREPIDMNAGFQRIDCYRDHAVAVSQDNTNILVVDWRTNRKRIMVKVRRSAEKYFQKLKQSPQQEANHNRISRASVLCDYLIAVDEHFDGTPFNVSAIYIPNIFGSISSSKSGSEFPEVSFEDLISRSNSIWIPRLETWSWEGRTKRLSPYSLTFTNWRRKKDRSISIRLLAFKGEEVQVSTIKLNIGLEETDKRLLALGSIGPRVDTQGMPWVQVQANLKRMTSSGRLQLVRPNRSTRIRGRLYAPYYPFCWTSLWALSSQERFDSIMRDEDREPILHDVIPQQRKGEGFACEKMCQEEYSSAVYTGPFKSHSEVEDIHIWFSA